jgi:cyclopropane fatty-acyl-phospholipid synthase-like methyltransferase
MRAPGLPWGRGVSDPKRVIEEGYDRIAGRYFEWSDLDPSATRTRFLGEILDRIPDQAEILELGCGAGIPVTRALAERGRVTGVDLSSTQLDMARGNVQRAIFLKADFTQLAWPAASVDAVVSFFAFNHVPRAEQEPTMRRIARWLRSGGLLAATLSSSDSEDQIEEDWLGVPMFFAGFGVDANEAMLRRAGFELELSEVREEPEDGVRVEFHFVIARRGP